MNDFLSPNAEFVKILGVHHLVYLFFCIVTVFLFIKNYKKVRENKEIIGKIFLCLLAFQQVFLLYGWYAVFTPNFWSEGLPLQMCRVASMLTIIFLISKNRVCLDILNYFGIFALISLFYPLQVYNFAHISGISYMINHIITVLMSVFAVIAYDWYPNKKTCKNAIIGFCVYFPLALVANYLTGGNYFYQTNRPFLHSLSPLAFGALTFFVTVFGFVILTVLLVIIKKMFFKTKAVQKK